MKKKVKIEIYEESNAVHKIFEDSVNVGYSDYSLLNKLVDELGQLPDSSSLDQ